MSVPQLCKIFKVGTTTIEPIERQYRTHGIKVFKEKIKKPNTHLNRKGQLYKEY